ncbi:MAG: Cytochrome c [Verrucomicrobiaceae bacterium]|nr:Cytochrome c [Verrucomicrobiaceae bacterium]
MFFKLAFFVLAGAAAASEFPAPYNTEPDTAGPMPAAEAAAKMTLPPGFKATVFAAEPDIQNPIAMTWDGRGRLWVAENYTYAEAPLKFDMKLRDRVLIFEDNDGDGHFDKRTVFTDEVQMLTSIEVGRGGVWAMCPPQLFFIPDANHDDVPDGPAEVVLDGFTVPQESYHNFANGLRFGPDGWLYGRVGGTAPGEIGAPGTADENRIPLRGGMWRYHPQTKVFQTITSGNTNPWGHDWNEFGDLFNVNTVNGHLWHAIPGAHFVRGSTLDPNPRAYSLIDFHADHWHFDQGKGWAGSRDGAANTLGGGHSHIGAMVYLGDNWPAEYRGHLFTLNQHGRRMNQEILEPTGSGYMAKHGEDFMVAKDEWFRGIDLSYGPDGGVFVIDWCDAGECHERNGVHRTSGRIFKITYGDPKPWTLGDLHTLDNAALVKLHTHPNEWFSRMARKELGDRAVEGKDLGDAKKELQALYDSQKDTTIKLRVLWSLYVIGGTDETFLKSQLQANDAHVRAWAIRLIADQWPADTLMSKSLARVASVGQIKAQLGYVDLFSELAANEHSAVVRLALASTLQHIAPGARGEIARGLVAHKEDADDHNLPLMIWYGLIPVADDQPELLAELTTHCNIPLTLKYIARRLGEDVEKNPAPLSEMLNAAPASAAADILAGLSEALSGWRKAPKPAAWDAFVTTAGKDNDAAIRELSVVFGDGRALDEVKKVALDNNAELKARQGALQTLIDNQPPDLRQICEKLLGVKFLNSLAAKGLAAFDDPAIGAKLVAAYKQLHQSERPQLLATLVSRPSFAKPLLDAVGAGKIPRADLSAFHARQIRSFKDDALNAQLGKVWGELHDSAADKQQLMAKLRKQLTPDVIAKADKSQGRFVFSAVCAACHRLYGEGNDIGPDLTGAGRDNIDYLLENIVDPGAVVAADFRMTVVTLKDGRVLNGFIIAKSDKTITLRTMTDKQSIEKAQIASTHELPQSLMPEGLMLAFNETQIRDLFAYLMHKSQVPLPAPAK